MTVPQSTGGRPVRTRFAPAPSGDLHVGNVRTGLYSWLFARRHGGAFVLRVEDTDRSRVSDEHYTALQDVLRWLGLDWDEGPGVDGPHAPYRQSERLAIYADAVGQLVEQGLAYPCYCTPEELAARREQAAQERRTPGYDGRCRTLTEAQRSTYETGGRRPAVRFRMPEGSTTFDDIVKGPTTFEHRDIPDFTLTRSDGHPLYMLAATVDDVLMRLTHIVRGEDLVSATPRQLALYRALGHPEVEWPHFAHLPLIVGEDGRPLSKRNGEVSIAWYRANGFTPEAMVNYLALLGWSMDAEHERFTLAELVGAFSLERVSKNPARFDTTKLEAINGEKIRELAAEELSRRLVPVLVTAGVLADPPAPDQLALLYGAVPLLQERMRRLTEAVELLDFLFVDELVVDPVATTALDAEAMPVLDAAYDVLDTVPTWDLARVEAALRTRLVDEMGLKPRVAFRSVRVAVTGRTVSPPLFESMVLLGREKTLARLAVARRRASG